MSKLAEQLAKKHIPEGELGYPNAVAAIDEAIDLCCQAIGRLYDSEKARYVAEGEEDSAGKVIAYTLAEAELRNLAEQGIQ